MAAAHRLPCTWLENGPKLYAACCKLNRRHVSAHITALLVLTHAVPRTSRAVLWWRCARDHWASATTSTEYILCFGQVTSGSSLTSMLLVWLAMGWRHGLSATRHGRDSDTRALDWYTWLILWTRRTLDMLYYPHSLHVTQAKIFFFVYKCIMSRTRLISNMAAHKIGTRR